MKNSSSKILVEIIICQARHCSKVKNVVVEFYAAVSLIFINLNYLQSNTENSLIQSRPIGESSSSSLFIFGVKI